jgi:gamma-glutamylcyclotransferase (GGCT)/AIG2-like uncharacterized protein YtfP
MHSPRPIGDEAGARLFVYGTLRKGFRSHGLLQRFRPRYLGAGRVRARLYSIGEYPGAKESENDGDRVQGELYWLPRAAAAFKVLDRFEGFHPQQVASNEFERRETIVTTAAGGKTRAWVYWLSGTHTCGRRILSGNFALHLK